MYSAQHKPARNRSIDHYLGALGRHRVLDKDEERRATSRIVNLELELWTALLDDPSGPGLRPTLPEEVRDATPSEVRAADPDRKLLEEVLASARRCRPDRRWLRRCEQLERKSADARRSFAQSNLRLVVKIARDYRDDYRRLGDMVQDGNLGLMQAIGRFDPSRGFRFATYAAWWIRQGVRNGLMCRARLVAVPRNFPTIGSRIIESRARLADELGREPTAAEIGADNGLSAQRVRNVENALRARYVSWDLPEDEPESPANEVRSEARSLPDPGGLIDARRLVRALESEMPAMSDLERDILRRRYGLDGEETQTLADIGKSHNLSRERIRQLQNRALTHLRTRLTRTNLEFPLGA